MGPRVWGSEKKGPRKKGNTPRKGRAEKRWVTSLRGSEEALKGGRFQKLSIPANTTKLLGGRKSGGKKVGDGVQRGFTNYWHSLAQPKIPSGVGFCNPQASELKKKWKAKREGFFCLRPPGEGQSGKSKKKKAIEIGGGGKVGGPGG